MKNNSIEERKEIMKRRILAALLAAAMAFSLAACGNEDSGKSEEQKEIYVFGTRGLGRDLRDPDTAD